MFYSFLHFKPLRQFISKIGLHIEMAALKLTGISSSLMGHLARMQTLLYFRTVVAQVLLLRQELPYLVLQNLICQLQVLPDLVKHIR